MKFFASLIVASLTGSNAISCHTGYTYESGCATASTATAGDCGGTYDQCYTWTYKLTNGCNYQSKGCDLSTSSWCTSTANAAYDDTCCDSDNCNADVSFSSGGGGGGGDSSSDAAKSFVSTASILGAAVATGMALER